MGQRTDQIILIKNHLLIMLAVVQEAGALYVIDGRVSVDPEPINLVALVARVAKAKEAKEARAKGAHPIIIRAKVVAREVAKVAKEAAKIICTTHKKVEIRTRTKMATGDPIASFSVATKMR